jgi:hypothetical protein
MTNETRRQFLRGSVGAAAMVAGAPLLAATTPAQVEGPFYPVREQLGPRGFEIPGAGGNAARPGRGA